MNVHIVSLCFDITFRDSDDGKCYAGDGSKLIRVYTDLDQAQALLTEWNPVFKAADNENTVFPVQPNNRKLKEEFGFTLHDLDQDTEKFELKIESHDVI